MYVCMFVYELKEIMIIIIQYKDHITLYKMKVKTQFFSL